MIERIHSLHAAEFGAALIDGVNRVSVNTGTEVNNITTGADIYSRHQSVVAQNPGASFESLAIAKVLASVPLTGLNLATSALGIYAKKRQQGGGIEGSGQHRKYTFSAGLAYLGSLSVSHQEDASITVESRGIAVGANNPLTIADSVTLPNLLDSERFTLGPVVVAGVDIADHLESIELNFGVNIGTKGAGSTIWPTFANVKTVLPEITFRGVDLEWIKTENIPLLGKAGTHANTTISLRKRLSGGTYTADETAEHIQFTCDGIVTPDDVMDASDTDEASSTIMMRARHDGTNLPLTIATAVALA
ncbi:MAG: hypothetical protein ACPGXK_00225 [Phycisphaerae bacterium]